MDDDQVAVPTQVDIQIDGIDADLQRRPEGGQRILRGAPWRAPVSDDARGGLLAVGSRR
jgi:hypothetical protein